MVQFVNKKGRVINIRVRESYKRGRKLGLSDAQKEARAAFVSRFANRRL